MHIKTFAAAAALALAPMAASAVTSFAFNGGTVQFVQHNALNPVGFTGLLAPTSTTQNVQLDVAGNNLAGCTAGVNCRLSPFAGMPAFAGGLYHSVQGGTGDPAAAPGGTLTFGGGTGISFLWGSPDLYNFVDFYSGAAMSTLGGAALIDAGAIEGKDAVAVDIFGFAFDKVVFRSNPLVATDDAFEISNLSVIPVPFGAALLVTAFGVAGVVSSRRRKAQAV